MAESKSGLAQPEAALRPRVVLQRKLSQEAQPLGHVIWYGPGYTLERLSFKHYHPLQSYSSLNGLPWQLGGTLGMPLLW